MAKSQLQSTEIKNSGVKNGAEISFENINGRDDDVIQRAIDAAARCIDTIGLDKTSVEDIVRESGVSRATLYRRFGNREAILTSLLQQQIRPIVDECIRIMASPATFAERIVQSTIYAVSQIPCNRFLKVVFQSGVSRSNLDLLRPVYKQLVNSSLLPALQVARLNGELRTDLDDDEVSEWLMRDFLLMTADEPLDEEQIRRRINQYVLPVLQFDRHADPVLVKAAPADESVETRLARMEQRLTEIQHVLGLMRQDFLELSNTVRGR